MPIQIVSSNLNYVGDSGNFESDPSTWNGIHFESAQQNFSISRSPLFSTKGSNSCKVAGDNSFAAVGERDWLYLTMTGFNALPNKKYILTANVLTDSSNPFADDACFIAFDGTSSTITLVSSTPVTIANAKTGWKQVVYKISTTSGFSPAPIGIPLLIYRTPSSGNIIHAGNFLFMDQIEVYEYIDVPNSLAFDLSSCVIVDDNGTHNGSVTVAVTGGETPYEYSITNGSSWQSSNVFTGLTGGVTYPILVRDSSPYTISHDFAINLEDPPFDFTLVATRETVKGANDGTITATVTGTSGPYEYSIDGMVTFQSSNVFAGLTPGPYNIYVRDTTPVVVVHSMEVPVGNILFQRIWWSRNPIFYIGSAETGWESLTNVRIYNDVQVDDKSNGTFISKLKVALPVDSDGNVVFYNRRAIERTLSAAPPDLIYAAENFVFKLTDRVKMFKNNTAQLSGTSTTPGATTPSLPHLVLLGGLSKLQWASIDFFLEYLPTKKKFMTWAPVIKPVDKYQEDYLNYFVFDKTTFTLKFKLKVYYDDATNETIITTPIDATAQYGDLYQFPAGPINSGAVAAAGAAGKNLVKYEISLLNQSDVLISEVRIYILDAVSHPRKRLFMFLNSLGSYEVLRFTGVAERQAIINKNEIAKFLPYNYSSLDGEREMNDVSLRESDNFSTGYFNDQYGKLWLDYMKDLLLSKRVFDVTDGNRVPVMIQPATYPMGADQNYEYYVRFVAADAYEDENYTPKTLP